MSAITLNVEERSQAFQKMGFWEKDISEKMLSCHTCSIADSTNDKAGAIPASECKQVESETPESRLFIKKLELFCPKCNSLLIGACIPKPKEKI